MADERGSQGGSTRARPHPMASVAMEAEGNTKRYESLVTIARKMAPWLARYGIVVMPDDLSDAVHEFWISSDGMSAEHIRFEAGEMTAYCRKALFRFTVRMWRQQRRFTQLFEGEGQNFMALVNVDEEEQLLNAHLKNRLQEVMNEQLGASRMHLILRFFEEGPRCERLLSREFSMTRYRVREEILNSVGIVVAHLTDLSACRDPDRQVALEIWRQNLSFSEAAMRLNLPLASVRQAHRRNLSSMRKLIL